MHRALQFATLSVFCVIGSFAGPRSAQAQVPPFPEIAIEDPDDQATFDHGATITPSGTTEGVDDGDYVTVKITNIWIDDMAMQHEDSEMRSIAVDANGDWEFPDEYTLNGGSSGGSWEVKAWISAFPAVTEIHDGAVAPEP